MTAAEAAEKYAIHISKKIVQCPACGEETLWKHVADDFIAGWDAAIKEVLEINEKFDRIEEMLGSTKLCEVCNGNGLVSFLMRDGSMQDDPCPECTIT
jgi:ssDNA-binding Zn-finger/Zn-ribbon topoisomerase 1